MNGITSPGNAARAGSNPAQRRRPYLWIGGAAALALAALIWVPIQRERTNGTRPDPGPTAVLLVEGNSFQIAADTATRRATYSFELLNQGSSSVEVRSFGRSAPGLGLVRTEPASSTIPARSSVRVVLTYLVSHCEYAQNSPWPMPVTARTNGTTSTVYVELRGAVPQRQWQQDVANAVCHPNG
jgi:hypothetical protein